MEAACRWGCGFGDLAYWGLGTKGFCRVCGLLGFRARAVACKGLGSRGFRVFKVWASGHAEARPYPLRVLGAV